MPLKPLGKVGTTVHVLIDLIKDLGLSRNKQKEVYKILVNQLEDKALIQAVLQMLIEKLIVKIPDDRKEVIRQQVFDSIRLLVREAAAGAAEGAVRGAQNHD